MTAPPFNDLSLAIQHGDRDAAAELTRQAIAAGVLPGALLNHGLLPGMAVVGQQFRDYEIFLPDVLLAARAMATAMDLLRPLLVSEGVPLAGRVVLGTVKGDLHDIGKNLVGIMLQGAGFEIIDLGVDVEPEAFVGAAVEHGASIIGMSALLTTTMTGMKDVIAAVETRGLRGRIKIIVGGAPVSEVFARDIGADAYASDATSAVACVRGLDQEVS
ncbi:MAG TPA: corrinoid protein [Vicinamibacterales bacterium]|nr:corrinoid protein [Vicinamibacterales bacterium]